MSAVHEERPTGESGALKAQAGRPFASYKNGTAELDLVAISEGSDNPRYEVYLRGWADGRDTLTEVVARLRWERDCWYFVANNKGKTPADFYRHLTNRLWDEASI